MKKKKAIITVIHRPDYGKYLFVDFYHTRDEDLDSYSFRRVPSPKERYFKTEKEIQDAIADTIEELNEEGFEIHIGQEQQWTRSINQIDSLNHLVGEDEQVTRVIPQ